MFSLLMASVIQHALLECGLWRVWKLVMMVDECGSRDQCYNSQQIIGATARQIIELTEAHLLLRDCLNICT